MRALRLAEAHRLAAAGLELPHEEEEHEPMKSIGRSVTSVRRPERRRVFLLEVDLELRVLSRADRSSRSSISVSSATGPSVSFVLALAGSVDVREGVLVVLDRAIVVDLPACTSVTNSLKATCCLRSLGLKNCQIARNITISRTQSSSVLCDCFTSTSSCLGR